MNLVEVNKEINELLNSPLTLSNARNLSALIIVQSYLQNAIQSKPDSLEQELNDILPRYKEYCEVKQRYQRNQASDDELIIAIRRVCKEVKEFLLILYQNTDLQIERTMIKNMVSEVREAIQSLVFFLKKCLHLSQMCDTMFTDRKTAVSNDRKERYEKFESVGRRLQRYSQ